MRTCNSAPLDASEHIGRLLDGCTQIGIQLPQELNLVALATECARRNVAAYRREDFSIVVLVTPGTEPDGSNPTVILHTSPIAWDALATWYQNGQSLRISTNQNVSASCWSPQLKTRSRMHYFLADQYAISSMGPFSSSILPNARGNLTETSSANFVIIESGSIICPPMDEILHGVSLARTIRLATKMKMKVCFESISAQRAMEADELLLCGSTGCIWPASQLEEREFTDCANGAAFGALRELWTEDIGLDFVSQAIRNSNSQDT